MLNAPVRHSRSTLALRQSSLQADLVADALVAMLKAMPAGLRRSITFDNGTEFNRNQRIASQLGLNAYFCDPRAPWQKGGVENAIGRLRRNLPRKTNLDNLSAKTIEAIIATYNKPPRKCHGILTPPENSQTIHFQR